MKHYIFIDYATQGYMALVGLLILFFHNESVPHWPWLLAGHGLALGLVHLLIQAHAGRPDWKLLSFFRHFYPVLLYTAFFRETGEINRLFVADYVDSPFILADQRLFGCQPSVRFMAALPYLVVSELFYAAYFSYYIMIAGTGLALFLRNRRQFYHYISVVSFVFYLCYLNYIILPVMGPRVFFRVLDGFVLPENLQTLAGDTTYPLAVQSGPFFQLMAWIYRNFEAPGAAFPSSHVAIAIVTVWFSFLYLRPIRWYHLTVAALLCLATVYCRYHYVVDTFAGVATAAVLVPVANRLYWRFSERTTGDAGSGRGATVSGT